MCRSLSNLINFITFEYMVKISGREVKRRRGGYRYKEKQKKMQRNRERGIITEKSNYLRIIIIMFVLNFMKMMINQVAN